MHDGLADAGPASAYKANFQARQAVPTDVTISLTALETGAGLYSFTATVCVESNGVGKDLRINMVETLDNYPPSRGYNRFTLRQGVEAQDIYVDPGTCAESSYTLKFDAASWSRPQDISIVAWAQDPLDIGPAEVHQAAKLAWPFIAGTNIFSDGFESGDTSVW